jgi:hypothetical protein
MSLIHCINSILMKFPARTPRNSDDSRFPPGYEYVMKGLSLIQLMVILAVLGVGGYFLISYIIDMRCEADPQRTLCVDRKEAS